jgi:heme/copper-type cytochrome/quinol oxidase subunit 2
MTDLGKVLVVVGGFLMVAGVVVMLLGKSHLPLGRLPGDIVYKGKNTVFYFPLASSILVSVVLSVLLYVVSRFRR